MVEGRGAADEDIMVLLRLRRLPWFWRFECFT
jgi:hypothetical protein